jgi:hypothetical protein
MKQLELIHRINELFSRFVTQIKGASSLNLYDINIISEYILIPLFKEIFDYSELRNVNDDSANYPGIDLADDTNRVAFQVTSTSNSRKINHTFDQFFRHELYEKYNRLYFYILTEKQESYTVRNYALEKTGFDFLESRDILDYQSLMKKINALDIRKIKKIQSILEEQFTIERKLSYKSDSDVSNKSLSSWGIKTANLETLYSNLLEISFPNELYIALLNIDRKEVIKASRVNGGKYLKNVAPTRAVIWEALRQKGLRFANDWTCHENKIITFHDLNDDSISLREIIDEGTVEPFGTDEFFLIDRDHENVFKGLLNYCLQRMLYHKRVEWKYKDKMFVFISENDDLQKREISWTGKVDAKRTVFDISINKKTGEISYYKHLAFKRRFKRFENRWFLEIVPSWYITSNGFRKSRFGADTIKWLKSHERNQHVFNHIKFIAYFLRLKEQPSVFEAEKPLNSGFLNFKTLVKLDGHPLINDNSWNRNESKEEQKRMKDPQMLLPLDFI